jgi:hypothetical protein
MVICIDEDLEEVHQHTFRNAEAAASLGPVALEIDDDGPNDDPPATVRLAA